MPLSCHVMYFLKLIIWNNKHGGSEGQKLHKFVWPYKNEQKYLCWILIIMFNITFLRCDYLMWYNSSSSRAEATLLHNSELKFKLKSDLSPIETSGYLYYYRRRVCVCVFAELDQFLPVRSHFDTKRPVNFFHIATFPSPTFGPLFAFQCPLFFTKNNNLQCRDVLKSNCDYPR